MTIQNAILVFVTSAILLGLELALYFSTGMSLAANSSGLAMVAAYKFLWLMVLTGAAGVLAPIGALIGTATNRRTLGLISWAGLIGLVMVGYTTISYLDARSAPTGRQPLTPAAKPSPIPVPSPMPPAASQPAPPAPAPSKKISEVVEFVDSDVTQADPEKIHVLLHFKNKTTRRITDLDYAFTFLDEGQHVLLSIDLRERLFVPPGLIAESTLDWTKSGFKDPAQFTKLSEALSKKTLKVSVTLQRATLDDGTVAEG